MAFIGPWPHLVRRFVATLHDRTLPSDLALARHYLTPTEQSLFLTMSAVDQRHSVKLCERLRDSGHRDVTLLRAALLHDVGKAAAPVPLVCRVIYSAAAVAWPRAARWLGRNDVGWRRPFFVAAHHPRLGARAAARAGSPDRVVELIGGHGQRGTDPLGQTLYDYDRRM